MNRIITAAQLRKRLSLADDDGVNDAIESALDAALIRTEAVLSTSFTAGTAEDVFFIDTGSQVAINGLYLLKLRNGLVKNAPPVLVTYGSNLADALSGGTSVTTRLLNLDKGFVSVEEGLGGSYVKVAYSYGLAESDEAPAWLQEVILGYTVKILSSQQIADGKPELSNLFSLLDHHGATTLDQHLRADSAAISPLG